MSEGHSGKSRHIKAYDRQELGWVLNSSLTQCVKKAHVVQLLREGCICYLALSLFLYAISFLVCSMDYVSQIMCYA